MIKLNRDVAIQTLINYKDTFLKLLDYINKHDSGYEVPVNFYLKLYNSEICELAKDDFKVRRNLSVASLVENKIFLEENKKKGVVILEPVIVDLLRFIDVNRSKELTRKDFEQMRAQLEFAVTSVLSTQLGAIEYEDAMRTFYNVLNSIHSKIRENSERLKVKVDEVAGEYKSLSNKDARKAFDLFDKVSLIYHRYVLPCFEFLNASTRLIQKDNFSDSVDNLIIWHEESGGIYTGVASTLQFSKNAIFSYYKDISEWERKLKQYSNSLEQERRSFIAIEAAFGCLMKDVEKLRHGKSKGFKLTPKSDVFKHFTALDGIESQNTKFQTKLYWKKDSTLRRFTDFIDYIDSKTLPKSKSPALNRLPPQIDIEEERKVVVSRCIFGIPFSHEICDLHRYLNEQLPKYLKDYNLVDLLYALECKIPEIENQLIWTNRPRRIVSDTKFYLEYVPLEFKEVALGV